MSDLLPLLENFDLRILNERPTASRSAMARPAGSSTWRSPRRRSPARSGTGRAAVRGSVLRRVERPGRERRLQPPRARRGLEWRQALCCVPRAATCCRPGCPSASATWSPCCAASGARARLVCCSRRASIHRSPRHPRRPAALARARDRRGARASHEPGRRPHPARVPRSGRHSAAHQTISSATLRARRRATSP